MPGSNDPIGDLFQPTVLSANVPTPVQQPARSKTGEPNSLVSWLIIIFLAAVFAFLIIDRWRLDGGFGRGHHQDRQEEKQNAATGYLILIHDRDPISPEQWDTLQLVQAFVEAHPGLEYRSVDDDPDDQATQHLRDFAKSQGVQPPCAIYKHKDGKLVRAVAWPKTEADIKKAVR